MSEGITPPQQEWEPCISLEEGEQAQCEKCKELVVSKRLNEHIYCSYCHKYLWREKSEISIR